MAGNGVAACARGAKPIVEKAMNNQPQSSPAQTLSSQRTQRAFPAPGSAAIASVNWGGMSALYVKEVRRFFKVQTQTIWAPAITTLLYLIIFTVALGSNRGDILGTSFINFLAPGLIAMAMIQNAFANASFSLLVGKIQGTIVDYLMPPLSELELLVAMVGAAVTRAVLVGAAIWLVMLFWPGVSVRMEQPWAVIVFGLFGSAMLGFLGLLTSIWAEKFDHAAAITNFVVAPLALLSGTFYTIDRLNPTFAAISEANPFHYAISGFRYGFIGEADISIGTGVAVLVVVNVALCAACFALLRSGWKLKP
jgi:ABC-2 type transport system permease protein